MADDLSDLVAEARREIRRIRLDPDLRLLASRKIANLLIEMRKRCRTTDGQIDWQGRSSEYRHAARDVWEDPDISDEDMQRLRKSVSFHVVNLLHAKVDGDELAAAGYVPASPAGRRRVRRMADSPDNTTGRRRGMMQDQSAMVDALEAAAMTIDANRFRGVEKEIVTHALQSLRRTSERITAQIDQLTKLT